MTFPFCKKKKLFIIMLTQTVPHFKKKKKPKKTCFNMRCAKNIFPSICFLIFFSEDVPRLTLHRNVINRIKIKEIKNNKKHTH